MTITPLSIITKNYINSPGYQSRRISFYNVAGVYHWNKPKDPDNVNLPATIIIELCSGGGGAASGAIIISDSLDKTGSVGSSGGGSAMPFAKTYNGYELNDSFVITVGAGGRGGLPKTKQGNSGVVIGNNGEDGGKTTVGPINVKNDILFSKEGKKSKYQTIDNLVVSVSGDDLSGYCAKFVSNEARPDGLCTHHNTYSGAAGSNFELTPNGDYQYKEAGVLENGSEYGGKSVLLGSGKFLGQNGQNSTMYGSGGNGGGITLLTTSDSDAIFSSKGGDGKGGYVKVTTIFGID